MSAFQQALAAIAAAVEAELERRLGAAPAAGEIVRPQRLIAAMRHGVLGGGKRLRPFLLVAAAELIEPEMVRGQLVAAAAALECLHCYSLIHDDLPAMDDDDLRRGRPTVHRAFDEATAILAGDGLLTLAFDILADPATHADPAVRVALVADLARASGVGGMVGGQMLDLAAEGRFSGGAPFDLAEADIRRLQAMKTGALIRAACVMGARLAGGSAGDVARLGRYGEIVGLAFQLSDDLLDVVGDAAVVGKATAKDAARGKATLVSLHGVAAARAELARLTAEAEAVLRAYGERAGLLVEAAAFIAGRDR